MGSVAREREEEGRRGEMGGVCSQAQRGVDGGGCRGGGGRGERGGVVGRVVEKEKERRGEGGLAVVMGS